RRVAHALLPTHRVADTPRQVLVRRPGQQLRLAGRGTPRPRGVLVEVPRRDVELAAREIALVAVDRLEAGAAVSRRDAVAELAAVERHPGGGADDAVGKVAALAVHLGIRRVDDPQVRVHRQHAAAEPRLRERVLAVVGDALAAARAQGTEGELIRRGAARDVGV